MRRTLPLLAAALLGGSVMVAGSAAAAGVPSQPGDRGGAYQVATPTPTATARPGGPPEDRPGAQGNRPENAGPPQERPTTAGAGASESTGSANRGGPPPNRPAPTLPPQASPRAVAAVAAAADLHARLRDRLEALRAIPRDADRATAVKAVMEDFSDLFHLVADAVHSVDAKPAATGTATPTGTATATATTTATAGAQ